MKRHLMEPDPDLDVGPPDLKNVLWSVAHLLAFVILLVLAAEYLP